MSTHFLLVRHGNTFTSEQTPIQVGIRHDLPLTEHGKQQAHDLAQKLVEQSRQIDVIYHGRLQRQIETASIISSYFPNCPVTPTNALDEIDYGLWEGLTMDQIKKFWAKEHAAWENQLIWPKHIFASKYEKHIKAIGNLMKAQKKLEYQNVMLVSSQGIFKLILHLNNNLYTAIGANKEGASFKVKTGAMAEVELTKSSKLKVSQWGEPSLAIL